SSTKSYTGHMFGASGALEALVSIKAINESFIPPTLGLYQPEFDLDFVPLNGRSQTINYALSNSFGFGGHNASLLFKKYRHIILGRISLMKAAILCDSSAYLKHPL